MKASGTPQTYSIPKAIHQIYPSLVRERLEDAKECPEEVVVTEPSSTEFERVSIIIDAAPLSPCRRVQNFGLVLTPFLSTANNFIQNAVDGSIMATHAPQDVAFAENPPGRSTYSRVMEQKWSLLTDQPRICCAGEIVVERVKITSSPQSSLEDVKAKDAEQNETENQQNNNIGEPPYRLDKSAHQWLHSFQSRHGSKRSQYPQCPQKLHTRCTG